MKEIRNIIDRPRNSSIELIKVIAIIGIVCSHVSLSIYAGNTELSNLPWINDINMASMNIQNWMLAFMKYLGEIGNSIFFVCTAWFLLDNDQFKLRKEISLWFDVWLISLIMLIVFIIAGVAVNPGRIFQSIFPTIFANNWYITCYLLFYPLHGYLNKLIRVIGERELLAICVVSSIIYLGMDMFVCSLFWGNELVWWIVIYLDIAYIKRYQVSLMNSKKFGRASLACGIVGLSFMIVGTEILGSRISVLSDKVLRWDLNCNPFIVLIAIGALILALQKRLVNKVVNYISSISLVVYLFHDNILVARYLRTYIWKEIYQSRGYHHVALLALAYAAVLFLVTTAIASIYKLLTRRLNEKVSNRLYLILNRMFGWLENRLTEN